MTTSVLAHVPGSAQCTCPSLLSLPALLTRRWPDASRSLKNWRLDQDGTVPAQVEARGVLSSNVLPYYPYRDDAVELYGIIRRYVKTVVEAVYSESGSLQADTELQQWRRELTTEIASGGVGMRGVAGDDVNGESPSRAVWCGQTSRSVAIVLTSCAAPGRVSSEVCLCFFRLGSVPVSPLLHNCPLTTAAPLCPL